MRDEGAQTISAPAAAVASTTTTANGTTAKKEGSEGGLFSGRGKYKFWALAAIILLAFWSMFTGSVSLKWSAVHLSDGSGDIDSPVHHDLDVLVLQLIPMFPYFNLCCLLIYGEYFLKFRSLNLLS